MTEFLFSGQKNSAQQLSQPRRPLSGKHVVFLEQYGELGGGQQVLLEIARAALDLGCRVTVLIPAGPCGDKLRAMGAEVCFLPLIRLSPQKSLSDILQCIRYGICLFGRHAPLLCRADLVYVNGNRLLPVALCAQLFLRRSAVFHIHLNHGARERKLFLSALRLRSTRALVLPSEFIRRELQAFDARFADPRVRVIPNGLGSRFNTISFEDRFTGRPLRHVGIVGRVSPEKGQDVLLSLASRFPQLYFHILGDAAFSDADYLTNLQRQAPDNVLFHGWVDDLPAKVREIGLQVCLVPSRCFESRCFEAAPLVPLEMTALSCLVAVRKTGALEDVALTLRLPSFGTDEDLELLLYDIVSRSDRDLAGLVGLSHSICNGLYGHEAFRQRLKTLFTSLLS